MGMGEEINQLKRQKSTVNIQQSHGHGERTLKYHWLQIVCSGHNSLLNTFRLQVNNFL